MLISLEECCDATTNLLSQLWKQNQRTFGERFTSYATSFISLNFITKNRYTLEIGIIYCIAAQIAIHLNKIQSIYIS